MSDVTPDPEPEQEAEEAPMWQPKAPADMIEDAGAPAGVQPAVAVPAGEPHPHQQVWVRHESGAGEPQLVSEHSLEAMAADGWVEMDDRPRLQENPVTGRLEAVSAPNPGPEGEEG